MIRNIKYKNIYVIVDDEQIQPTIEISSKNDNVIFNNIEIENIFLNGKWIENLSDVLH